MHPHRSAAAAATCGSARGLGVCDALHVHLSAIQRERLAAALDARIAALTAGAPDDAVTRRDEQRLLTRMRAQLPDRATPFALVGPAGLVLAVAHDCLAGAVEALAGGLRAGAAGTWSPDLASGAAEAGAWIATALDCRAVEGFCFEAGADPAHPW